MNWVITRFCCLTSTVARRPIRDGDEWEKVDRSVKPLTVFILKKQQQNKSETRLNASILKQVFTLVSKLFYKIKKTFHSCVCIIMFSCSLCFPVACITDLCALGKTLQHIHEHFEKRMCKMSIKFK